MAMNIQPPEKWGNLEGIPADLTDGKIYWGEVVDKPNILPYNPVHNGTNLSLNDFTPGIVSGDYSPVDGFMRGWHILTLGNARATAFTIQIAFSDTDDQIIFRRRTNGTWFPWVRITTTTITTQSP